MGSMDWLELVVESIKYSQGKARVQTGSGLFFAIPFFDALLKFCFFPPLNEGRCPMA
jgi:hypothetical protein